MSSFFAELKQQYANFGKSLDSILILIILISGINVVRAVSAQGQTYYVAPASGGGSDSNLGTISQPWQSIQKAANTMVAGDTVQIRSGTYTEQVITQNSGSVDNYISYQAYPGETVTIDGTGITLPDFGTGLFVVEDRSYIKVSGLRMVNAGPNANNAGIYIDNSHYVIVEKNYTYNTVSSGIGVWGGSNIIIDSNEVQLACNDGEQEDISVSGVDTFEVRNNTVHNGGPGTNGGEGITIKGGATNGLVYGNHVYDITGGQRTCLYVDGWGGMLATSNIRIYRNLLHNCSAGITLSSEDGSLVTDILIYNNIVYNSLTNGLEIGYWGESGVSTRPVKNVTFVNNTVYNNGVSGWGSGFYSDNKDIANIVLRNNIFSANATSQLVNESSVAMTIDHNLIYGTQEYSFATDGSDAVHGDPRFINPGVDFHLGNGSPAIDVGSIQDAPTDDYQGHVRPQDGNSDGVVEVDIGAYEYMGIDPSSIIILLQLLEE